VFLITHDLDTLYAICDRVAVLADRKVVVAAPLDEVERFDHPWAGVFPRPRARRARCPPRPAGGDLIMETKAHYILIGAFTLIIGFGLLLFGLWAAKYSSDRTWQNYKVVFHEAVTGLSVGSPVQYNGIAVGSITKLSLAPDDPRQVIADVRIESNTPIKTDTRAKLGITSLTGPTVIQLSGGTPGARELREVDHHDEPVIQTTPSALQNVSDTANRIADRLDQILSDGNIARINATLANLEKLSGDLGDDRQGVQALLVSHAMPRATSTARWTPPTA
jgi:phospholipid/cholesterol/gamma-HCH transport system substrate-binding protein